MIDVDALAGTLNEFERLTFPGHPDDPDLAEWVLELTELDGHLVGLAKTALASSSPRPIDSHAAVRHQDRLKRLGAVGSDEAIYNTCLDYIEKLVEVEALLSGRNAPRANS